MIIPSHYVPNIRLLPLYTVKLGSYALGSYLVLSQPLLLRVLKKFVRPSIVRDGSCHPLHNSFLVLCLTRPSFVLHSTFIIRRKKGFRSIIVI